MNTVHREVFWKQPGSPLAVLLIHGIIESPNQFAGLLKQMKGRCTFHAILLPGHGTSGRNFARSNLQQWEQAVEQAICSLLEQHEQVAIVGHSMGSLLAIQAAVKHPGRVKGLFLLSTPMVIRLRPRAIYHALGVALGCNPRKDPALWAAARAYCLAPCHLWDYPLWIPRYLELFSLARKARSLPPHVQAPVVLYQAKRDEYVSTKSCHYLNQFPLREGHLLSHSHHIYYTPKERRQISNRFTRWLSEMGALSGD